MAEIILSVNAGSSSVKVSVYKAYSVGRDPEQIAEAQLSGLTAPPAKLDYSRGSEKKRSEEVKDVNSQEDAFDRLLQSLVDDRELTEVSRKEDINYVCHRVVHGGDYARHRVIDSDTYHHLEELRSLAPLHNAAALKIIDVCLKSLPNAKNIAQFDSSFHQTISDPVRTYLVDPHVAQAASLRKYGFHGISYAFITHVVADWLKKDVSNLNIIALHLGSGASACAIRNGKSIDTSMGLTPLDGLPGATRSGSVDPSLPFHFSSSGDLHMHVNDAEEILNKRSGWKALTGTTDFGHIASSNSPECKLAFEIFADRILGFIGSYFVKLEGKVDALVFAGGIGEKADTLRATILDRCACLGFHYDPEENKKKVTDVVVDIAPKDANRRVLICQTDEQFEMARSCVSDSQLFNTGHK